MNKLAMFVPLAKADAAQRLVFGSIDETPDRAREIMDYETAKPAFQEWSDGLFKASGGKSYGNVRGQHNAKIAAGVLREIEFDDEAKRISFCAHIVDDAEWAKVEAGVYTGFSPGGSYAKRWNDPSVAGHKRYTPLVGELSIVDVPCIPSASFTMTKADGSDVQIDFVMSKAYEPGNEATKGRAEEMAKADAGSSWKDHIVQARADLIAENAVEALTKIAPDVEPESEPNALLDSLNAALAKADGVIGIDTATKSDVTVVQIYARSLAGELLKSDVILPVAPPSPESVALIGADLTKSFLAVAAIRAAAEPVLAKGLYSLSDAVCSLQSFAWLTQDVTDEAGWEGDGSPLPQMAVNILQSLKAFLISMVEEEVSEMLSRLQAEAGEDMALVIEGDGAEMELAAKIIDLVKANEPLMAKAGARNSRIDATRIQAIHDNAGELGAVCAADGETAEKVAALSGANEQLTKAVESALPRLEALTAELDTVRAERAADREAMAKMQAEIVRIGGEPAMTKIEAAVAAAKEADNLTKTDVAEPTALDQASLLPAGARARALEELALNSLHRANR